MNVNNSLNHYSIFSNSTPSTATESLAKENNVSSLKEGQVFEGSINHIDENGKVTIGLANGQTMTARLDTGVSIQEGQSLFFQVKSNDGSLIQIRPVSTNLENNPTLLKALDSANLTVTDKTLSMVNTMMKESMPIDSDSLLTMNRAILSNPSVDPQTVVLMSKFNIPVNTENANMFEAYSQNEVAINSDIDKLATHISNILSDKNISFDQIVKLNDEISQIFVSEDKASDLVKNIVDNQNTIVTDENIQKANTNGQELVKNEPENNDTSISVNQNITNNAEKILQEKNTINDSSNTLEVSSESEKLVQNGSSLTQRQVDSLLNELKEFSEFMEKSQQIDKNQSFIKDFNPSELFKEIATYIKENPDISTEKVRNLFSSNGFKHLLQNMIKNEFSLDLEELPQKDSLSKLYEKILKDTEQLEKAVESLKTKLSGDFKSTTDSIKNNVSFMNASNEIYNFIQIPLKMFNQNTDSTLYVKQNKKRAYENGEEITCFLHFDMKFLGPTDIYIKLQEKNVKCNWYLADEKSMDLIEANLDILYDRLNEKGFNCTSEVSCENKRPDFVNDFLRSGSTVSTELVHRYSFDMRA